MAPPRLGARKPLRPGTGWLADPLDLSHLTGQKIRQGVTVQSLPSEFDWRDKGGVNYVTSVKDQGSCGSCYAFGPIGAFEAKLLIDGAGTFDLSENHAKECNWREVNDYQSPGPGDYWGSCDGGNARMIASLFSQTGTVTETCDFYEADDVACNDTCPYEKTLLDWRYINGDVVPSPEVLKQYLYSNGPIITSMDADSGQGFDSSYDGSYTFDYAGSGTNHCVLIVGWSDNLPPVEGGFDPAQGWIVKNSWGTGWGDDGYFYITYGAANIGTSSSFVHEWQDYDRDGDIWYYDDDGWSGSHGYGSTTAWGLARFTADRDTKVTRVEFWTTDATTDVDVYVFGGFNGLTLSNKLAEVLNNSYSEAGYHSVELNSPVQVNNGDDVVAVVKFTNDSYGYPVPTDSHGPVETGRTFISLLGTVWVDLGLFHNTDAAIRVRTSPGPPFVPDHFVYLPLVVKHYPPIPETPVLYSIGGAADGDYTVSWSSSAHASTYILEESDNAEFSGATRYPATTATFRSISGKGIGTYYYRVKASNAWGDSGWSNTQIAWVLPPATFDCSADATIYKGDKGTNYGGYPELYVGYGKGGCFDVSGDYKESRALLGFDLSSIPGGTPINDATLHLRLGGYCCYTGGPRTVTVYRAEDSWSELTVTWNNRPDYAEAYGSTSVDLSPGNWIWYSFDVTDLVRGWVAGAWPNNGMIVRAPETSGDNFAWIQFYSSEAALAPYLEINYGAKATSAELVPALEETIDPFGLERGDDVESTADPVGPVSIETLSAHE
ncbi:MAG: C1 family peptidase [Anaerolineae bacterium]|jgi:C1A family cysteine protease